MQGVDWTVLAVAAAGIAAVLWYFFGIADKPATPAPAAGVGPQEITIEVRGGYSPRAVRARAGVPLTLIFDRQDKSSCSEEIVIPDFGIRRFLPSFEKTRIEIPSATAGTHEFMCGMGMLHGTLIVE